jgi:hypothetical protein
VADGEFGMERGRVPRIVGFLQSGGSSMMRRVQKRCVRIAHVENDDTQASVLLGF